MHPALAPGKPGNLPYWSTGAKSGVGTPANQANRIWFTLAEGIVTEVYYPKIHQANIRHLAFFVTNGVDFFSDERTDTQHETTILENGIPAYQMVNTCNKGFYRITKTIFTDPDREVLVVNAAFEALQGKWEDYHLYAYLNPHIDNANPDNRGWIGDCKGFPLFYTANQGTGLALGCSIPFKAMTCGYAGISDGVQDLQDHKRLTSVYRSAEKGNIGCMGEIDLKASKGLFTLALGFGSTWREAGLKTKCTLLCDSEAMLTDYCAQWKDNLLKFKNIGREDPEISTAFRTSLMVLQTHWTKDSAGSLIASLAIPWGETKQEGNIGGMHLIWIRDLVEAAYAFLAADDPRSALQILAYLMSTQETDGHWPQCMDQDGASRWDPIRMEEAALPILLADHLYHGQCLKNLDPWKMIRKAASFIVTHGPLLRQSQREEDCGYTPYTLAVEVAALLAAADFFERQGAISSAQYLRETADLWNELIEPFYYVTGTETAKLAGVEGYYVRLGTQIQDRSRPIDDCKHLSENAICADALALVRFGLRAPDDPRILGTLAIIDAMLKMDTDKGPIWHRYLDDGYGEHRDGAPFDGYGIGRGWPLLAGERAHYEVARGNFGEAERLLKVMQQQANPTFLIPEQVWDDRDIPEKALYNGCPTGSSTPLVRAHAEYLKLVRSIMDKQIFDMPSQALTRYQMKNSPSPFAFWRFGHQASAIPKGKIFRVETHAEASVRWTADGWKTWQDAHTADTGLGIHHVDLPTAKLPGGTQVTFTFHWIDADRWEGRNFDVWIR